MSSDSKKKSFYVLFLGAKESQGLRGANYIEPVLQYFVSQEHRMQALKVTLQLSNKGLRIIPTNLKITSSGSGIVANNGTIDSLHNNHQTEKHFIPHHAITCVFQAPPPNDDIVSCILLIYNPDTKCPVHVHCYRCDSPETATILREQFEGLVNREDNQRKFKDIESRLQSKGLLPYPRTSPKHSDQLILNGGTQEFDCRKSDSSENSDRGFGSGGSGSSNLTTDRVASLYDSLAAELREKLNARKQKTPLLLPPRDYDTMHRQRGNLSGIEGRRCSNPAVVGSNRRERRSYTSREQDSCGRSSGIGSAEDNCSPVHDSVLDNQAVPSSSDDEDWNSNQVVVTENSQYLVKPIWPTSSPKAVRRSSSSPVPPPLPKRPELRQRAPEMVSTPPLPVFSKERFEGVRQKWERLDHQYVKQKGSANNLESADDGFRSKEAVEADYRRQLSRESLLRSASRSNKAASRDSLDRWVENGIRSRGAWRRLEENVAPTLETVNGSRAFYHHDKNSSSAEQLLPGGGSINTKSSNRRQGEINSKASGLTRTSTNISSSSQRHQLDSGKKVLGKGYRELNEEERFPGLDRETARTTIHSSSLNLNHQHIYSEPSYETSLLVPTQQNSTSTKSKKFSFAFWKN